MSDFQKAVRAFNQFYGLPCPATPTITSRTALRERLKQVKKMLADELDEIDDIYAMLDAGPDATVDPYEVLTACADLFGDIQVYCASEMVRMGIDNDIVLGFIMASNMSKADANGNPIIKDGKVQKGPNYWKPEPAINAYIQSAAGNWGCDTLSS